MPGQKSADMLTFVLKYSVPSLQLKLCFVYLWRSLSVLLIEIVFDIAWFNM